MSNLEKIQEVFNSVFDDSPQIDENTQKSDIEAWDSMSHLTLILELESAFDVSFEIEQIENIKSVKDILDAVS
jgi:acyl carrier protein